MGVDWDLSTSLTIVMGNPNEREKPIGFTMACVPVTMALPANATLIILKVGRRKFMIGIDEVCRVLCQTESGLIKIKCTQMEGGMRCSKGVSPYETYS